MLNGRIMHKQKISVYKSSHQDVISFSYIFSSNKPLKVHLCMVEAENREILGTLTGQGCCAII